MGTKITLSPYGLDDWFAESPNPDALIERFQARLVEVISERLPDADVGAGYDSDLTDHISEDPNGEIESIVFYARQDVLNESHDWLDNV